MFPVTDLEREQVVQHRSVIGKDLKGDNAWPGQMYFSYNFRYIPIELISLFISLVISRKAPAHEATRWL